MIKGHVCIDLHNHNSGFTERIEKDNMVTNAPKYLIQFTSLLRNPADRPDQYNFTPLGSRGMGGVVLFDGKLTEDASNIKFPDYVHIIGHAGTNVSTSTKLGGSLNKSESHISNSQETVTHVWDFTTSQSNGKIHSLARVPFQIGNNLFRPEDYYSAIDITPDQTYIIKVENNYVYYIGYSNVKSTSITLTLYKEKLYLPWGRGIGLQEELYNISSFGWQHTKSREIIWSKTITINAQGSINYTTSSGIYYTPYIICNRYIYLQTANMGNDYSKTIIILDKNDVFTSSPTIITADLPENQDQNTPMSPYDDDGTAIWTSTWRGGINCKIKCDGTVIKDTSNSKVEPPNFIITAGNNGVSTLLPWGNTCRMKADNYTSNGVIEYPDGTRLQLDPNSSDNIRDTDGIITHNNLCYNDSCYFINNTIHQNSQVMCTICNLDETITKTESTSMKITYTLSDE